MPIIKYEFSECVPLDGPGVVGGWILHGLGKGLDNPLEGHIFLSAHNVFELK